ncbi:MAG TPA: hypothetical protein VGX76_01930 [Pirellulales bacterium]|nr:hypothetical protein [Pirellulales bacterium]
MLDWRFWLSYPRWFNVDRGPDRLCQPIEHVGPQRRGTFEKVAEPEYVKANLGGDGFQRPSASMDGPAQVSAERILGGRLVESLPTFNQFRELDGDLLTITAQLLQELDGH